jgi:hypothetical protein
MITIRNINANLGEAGVEFTQETLQAAMDEMSQTVRDCGYECIEVCEGVDFEIVPGPSGSYLPNCEILNIISERIAAGQGDRDDTDSVDTYAGIVIVDGWPYRVDCAWPDGLEGWRAELSVATVEGDLMDYDTAEWIRAATPAEVAESLSAGYEGVIWVDGRRCYVCEG